MLWFNSKVSIEATSHLICRGFAVPSVLPKHAQQKTQLWAHGPETGLAHRQAIAVVSEDEPVDSVVQASIGVLDCHLQTQNE